MRNRRTVICLSLSGASTIRASTSVLLLEPLPYEMLLSWPLTLESLLPELLLTMTLLSLETLWLEHMLPEMLWSHIRWGDKVGFSRIFYSGNKEQASPLLSFS